MSVVGLYGERIPTKRQQQVIRLVAKGWKNKEVAAALGTTEYMIKNYLREIFDKLGFWNRVELALWYESRRLVVNVTPEAPASARRKIST